MILNSNLYLSHSCHSDEAAQAKGMKTIALTGKDGGKMAGCADIEIRVPHFGYADRIQEIHSEKLREQRYHLYLYNGY